MGNYSGNSILVDNCPKIQISDVVADAKKELLPVIMKHITVINGYPVSFTTSKLAHGGERIWFKCPLCSKRIGVVYKSPLNELVGCRDCLGLEYRSRRYKGMVENMI